MSERLGHAGLPRPEGRLIWLHGASVGEAMSLLPLVRAMQSLTEAQFLVTTGTVTSARRLEGLLPEGAMHQYVPVDTAGAVTRFLDHWRPDLGIWVESELWPRLVFETAQRGTPMAMVNARLSANSHARWMKARRMAHALFSKFSEVLSQDNETITRLSDFGVAAEFAGNLKALVDVPNPDPAELKDLHTALGARPVWLAASTHPGEDEVALAAQKRIAEKTGALLILAPRHPERGDTIAEWIESGGSSIPRRSAGQTPRPEDDVYLADTLGEMGLWYRLAPVTFVGGSFADVGGHTPFEPISCGSAVIHGPNVQNFAPAYSSLAEGVAALAVTRADDLGGAVAGLLEDQGAREELTLGASRVHDSLKPDVDAIAAELLALMEDHA
ncbi:MAG: 3-deoxy-D-manno-octulosonic acid transferase [Pseudomonadota bacterium]